MKRLLLPLVAMLLAGCEALSPRPATIEQRLAALPLAGAAVQRPVTIRWNDHLVPWVEAETDRDLFFALGLVHGHLRGAQVALLRLAARGRLSEVAGRPGPSRRRSTTRCASSISAAPRPPSGTPGRRRRAR